MTAPTAPTRRRRSLDLTVPVGVALVVLHVVRQADGDEHRIAPLLTVPLGGQLGQPPGQGGVHAAGDTQDEALRAGGAQIVHEEVDAALDLLRRVDLRPHTHLVDDDPLEFTHATSLRSALPQRDAP